MFSFYILYCQKHKCKDKRKITVHDIYLSDKIVKYSDDKKGMIQGVPAEWSLEESPWESPPRNVWPPFYNFLWSQLFLQEEEGVEEEEDDEEVMEKAEKSGEETINVSQ